MKLTILCWAAVAVMSLGGCAEGDGDEAAAAMTYAATPPEDVQAAGGMVETSGEKAEEPAY